VWGVCGVRCTGGFLEGKRCTEKEGGERDPYSLPTHRAGMSIILSREQYFHSAVYPAELSRKTVFGKLCCEWDLGLGIDQFEVHIELYARVLFVPRTAHGTYGI
jgi:hypothetical protein